jgi:transcriptional regulator PpsR
VRQFRSVKESLGRINAETTARLITAAADIALVLDQKGVILDLAHDGEELPLEEAESWLGRPFIDTVTIESRPKVKELLNAAAAGKPSIWRQVNHPASGQDDIPIVYAAAATGDQQRVVVIGRDQSAIAAMQQRLVDAQQSMERDYSRMRHAETRYRLLFQTSADAVMVVDSADRKILEANPAAARLFASEAERLVGRRFEDAFEPADRPPLAAALARVLATGRSGGLELRLAAKRGEVSVSAALFRQNLRQKQASLLLIRLVPTSKALAAELLPLAKQKLLTLVETAPDGLLVTDAEGRIIAANAAFLDLVEMVGEDQAVGQSLDRWLGRPGVDLRVMLANLRDHGTLRLFATTLKGEHGRTTEVEISAAALARTSPANFGFAIRHVGQRLTAVPAQGRNLPRSVDQMTELVGRVPLKEVVREATDVIEKLCIEAALELTGDNRASAAEMLGLSRQSLYVKLRRYGMADMVPDNGGS